LQLHAAAGVDRWDAAMHLEISNYNSQLLKDNTEARPLSTWWSRLGITKSTTAGWHCHYRTISTSSARCRLHLRVLLWIESVYLVQWKTALWIEQYVCFRFPRCPYPRAGRLYPMPHSVGALNARCFIQSCEMPKPAKSSDRILRDMNSLTCLRTESLAGTQSDHSFQLPHAQSTPSWQRPEVQWSAWGRHQDLKYSWKHPLQFGFEKDIRWYKNWGHLLPHWWGNQSRFVGFTQRESCRFWLSTFLNHQNTIQQATSEE